MLYFKRVFTILILSAAFLGACKKEIKVRTSGTSDTIDNFRYQNVTYYYYGFSFSQAKLVSTESTPGPDIVLYRDDTNTPSRLTLQANNRLPSFLMVEECANEDEAKKAFDNLKTFRFDMLYDMADPIAPNQVWIYRSNDEKYTKFRIVEIVSKEEQGIPYDECTFQWVHQPDGSLSFP